MSSLAGGIGAAGMYAVVSSPTQVGAKPEEAEGKAHHLKSGKGFINPWESHATMSVPKLLFAMLW
jgi:N-acyl-phosphatidylethanolamine-hydrolysing phospholipase D